MSTTHPVPPIPPSEPPAGAANKYFHMNFWIRELPFSLVLILTLVGVAYTSFSKQPITGYWEILAPLIALVCVGSGWDGAADLYDLKRGDLVFWRGHVAIVRDRETLLHANAFHMAVTIEPLAAAILRTRSAGSDITGVRRLG